ncbi:murein biosynthesis protein MurJ [Streptomyces scabiei]|uniref:murein biosynthesis integral membrane protein MurJ n=1 Tax=Streptomyces scabiei TaxID=1930 RepID=UPI0004E77DA9|nr:membrane protein [Streptomyces scabiei]MBP5863643.1 murein biosynthesis protein MurJ [Streptomyces sp. LBUM 1484]MBP5875853.1 murein biosynthesis protein MurJ [Streptomyces sp. LBUM 1477]MBP5883572.1 murein biosynthesis protein MurJ [Streptomyces sp. LBUM 1487]QTU50918.1 murein biosynthesis protein MurJ [Streptomyces sp. LBUM 1482]QTU67084.1 murein biosynthesis protein MurJ [Streptomyces sp. LBUM 1475]
MPSSSPVSAPVPPASGPSVPGARAPEPSEVAPPTGRFLAKATLVTAALTAAAALLGLGRDQSLSYLFGAGSETDAFLVAWTVPEFAATLLIEDGMAFVLVPAFSVAVARRARGGAGPDPVRALVASTLPRLALAFAASAVLLILGAPYLVEALAPGLPNPRLAVDCTRLTGTCVLTFGLAGYCSAALRAHRRFMAPAAIYVAYNVGIITAMFVLGGRWGVRAAALGVAVGGVLMIATQLPALLRQLRRTERGPGSAEAAAREATHRAADAHGTDARGADDKAARPVELTLIATVLLFALCRQSQVLIERFLGSTLPAGAISHLNYAQKVAQIPMTFSLMLCTVTLPVVAQAMAEGDTERARSRVEKDLALVSCIVLLGAAAIFACGPQLIELLFQRGAFTARDTAATAAVMRVYALGLLGHALVSALVRSYFSAGRPTWYPLAAMAAGIVATSWIGAATVGSWGVLGIAAANAFGITLTALILLHGMRGRAVPIRTRQVVGEMTRPVRAAVAAGVVGMYCADRFDSPVLGLAVGGAVVALVFVLLASALGASGVTPALRSVTRRLPYVRNR